MAKILNKEIVNMTQEEIQNTIRTYSDDLERLYDRIASIKNNIQYIQKSTCNHPNMDNCQCSDCGYLNKSL